MFSQNALLFKSLKQALWPIRQYEIRRVVYLALLLFLVCFNYSMLRCLKDTVVVTASSAAVIPFIKVWTLLPMAVFFTFIYARISAKLSHEIVFYLIVSVFTLFFVIFAFLIYPNAEIFHLREAADFLRNILPEGLSGMIAMIEYWSFTLFYIIAELWSTIILSILTWGLINQVTNLEEAPRFYAVLSVCSNLAAVAAGLSANIFVGVFRADWHQSLQCLITIVSISSIAAMFLYKKLAKDIFAKKDYGKPLINDPVKFSLRDSFYEVANSRHLRYLAIIVISYFFVINTVEVIWKEQLRLVYPSPIDFNHYMNTLTASIGVVSTISGIFVAALIGRFGWTKTALLTPMVMLITSLLFFIFIVFKNDLGAITLIFGTTPLAIAVFLGGLQNCMSKGAKYSIFDSTKEMAFIPLERSSQIKGKAAVDGVFSRLGKSGASLTLQGMILAFGGLISCTPYIMVIMLMVIVLWIEATRLLGAIIDKAMRKSRIDSIAIEEEPGISDDVEVAKLFS